MSYLNLSFFVEYKNNSIHYTEQVVYDLCHIFIHELIIFLHEMAI